MRLGRCAQQVLEYPLKLWLLEGEGGEVAEAITHRYYFVSTKSPDNKAIDGLLDRALGKSVQRTAGAAAAAALGVSIVG